MKRIYFLLAMVTGLLAPSIAPAFADTFGRMAETLPINRNLTLNLNQSVSWYLAGVNKPEILDAELVGSTLKVTAKNPGLATVYTCPTNSNSLRDCFYLTVTVTQDNILGVSTESIQNEPHQIGSFVIVGKTVYYVHSHGLIPIPTWNIYLSVAPAKTKIIPANDYDLQLPLLPLMENNDSRVK